LWNNKSAPKVPVTEGGVIEESIFVSGWADWKFNLNTPEHLAYICDIPLRPIKSICGVAKFAVKEIIVVDHNAKDVTRAVGLQGLLQGRLLAFVLVAVNAKEDFKISLGLLNGLQDHGALVAFRVVEPNSSCDL